MNIAYFAITFFIGILAGVGSIYFIKKRKCPKKLLQNWQETFDSISDPISILSLDGKILQANKAMELLNHQHSKLITDFHCFEIVHNSQKHIEGCPLARSKISFKREEMELHIDNNIYLITVDPIIQKNKITSFVHVIKDITHIKKLQIAMEEEKRKFETLVNNLPGFVYRCANDKEWTMQYISHGCEAITGYSAEDFINNKKISFNDIIDTQYREYLWNKWQTVLARKETFEDEYEIITKDGNKRWVWERGEGVFDKNGNLLFIEGFITDITDKKQIFNALQESEEKFKSLNETTSASIFIYQGENFVYVNPATETLTGYTSDEILEKKFWDIVHPDFREIVKERGKMRLMGIRQPSNYDFKIIHKNGEERWIKFSAGYLNNYKGKPAAIGTAIDITDLINIQSKLQEFIAQLEESERLLKQQNEEYLSLNEELKQNNQHILKLNEELIKAKNKAEANDRLKTSFLNNISHEIRTPLNAILGFSDLLSKRNLNQEKTNQYLSIIKSSGNHLLNVITNIINVATIEAGEEKIYYRKVNLNNLIENTIKSSIVVSSKQNIEIAMTEKLSEEKAWLLSDETKLHQIISNLLDNAIKFTDKGFIHIGVKEENNSIIISVKDSGVGIEENLQPYIFERFVQVGDIVKKHPSSGMGLGLSLVKSYVHLLNGTIELHSKVGYGSEFIITLPYLPVIEDHEKSYDDLNLTIPPNKKIILAEDNTTNIELIKEYLQPYKINLLYAINGKEAIELIEKHPDTDLILMDIKMPEMDGYEACQRIKEILPNMTIIGLTAYSHEEDFEKMKKCGMVSYLTKPIEKQTLLSELEKFLK